jgi:hypothetical protein
LLDPVDDAQLDPANATETVAAATPITSTVLVTHGAYDESPPKASSRTDDAGSSTYSWPMREVERLLAEQQQATEALRTQFLQLEKT